MKQSDYSIIWMPAEGLTQSVDHADAAHIEGEQCVVDGLAALVVHEEVVDHRAQLRG